MEPEPHNRIDPLSSLHSAHADVTSAQHRMLKAVAACDSETVWDDGSARDFPHWLSMQLGISSWAARRWINAAHALPDLPRISCAFESGTLGFDKVLDLSRFATPGTERTLVSWARRVSPGCVREKADASVRQSVKSAVERDRQRYLHYWFTDDRKVLSLQGVFPGEQGAVVAKALDRLAGRLPDIIEETDTEPDEGLEGSLEVRRADALVAMCSRAITEDQDADRATVVVQAELRDLVAAASGDTASGCKVENGPIITADTALRLCCDSRLQTVLRDGTGNVVGIGDTSRTVPRWLMRQLRYRDGRCTFPGCEAKWFLHAHHIEHWIRGGPTDLDNLVLVCMWHHKLVHEHGWNVKLQDADTVTWYRPNGAVFEPGRAPPDPSWNAA